MKKKLVLGNPGTGKTYNLTKEINELINTGIKPPNITILSHTRVAAYEIAERASAKGTKASTIHALAYQIAKINKESVVSTKEIRAFSESLGIPMKGSTGDTDESLELGDEYLSVINYANATMQPLSWAYNRKDRPGSAGEFEYFHKNYAHWKNVYGFVDFDDMLAMAIAADKHPDIPVLFIDEAQDLSKRQWRLIDKISKNTDYMLVTGDPDQALFSWGGAWPQGMLDWANKSETEIVELRQSYRVPQKPYFISREIITKVKDRYEKDYIPTDVKGEVNRFLTVDHYDFARMKSGLILYRNHALRKAVEDQLLMANKAYTTLNGFPGPIHNKFGKGAKAWINIRIDIGSGMFPDKKDVAAVKKIATPRLIQLLQKNDLEGILQARAEVVLDIPYRLFNYYRHVKFDEADKIKLSTIHGAKGMEDDLVVIINGMTQRVIDESTRNPDSEYQVWYVAVTRTKNKLHIIDGEGAFNPL